MKPMHPIEIEIEKEVNRRCEKYARRHGFCPDWERKIIAGVVRASFRTPEAIEARRG